MQMAFKTEDLYIIGDFNWLCILCRSNTVTMGVQSFHKLTHMAIVRGATKMFPKFLRSSLTTYRNFYPSPSPRNSSLLH